MKNGTKKWKNFAKIVNMMLYAFLFCVMMVVIYSEGYNHGLDIGRDIYDKPPKIVKVYTLPEVSDAIETEPIHEVCEEAQAHTYTAEDAEALAKMVWGEARGVKSDTEKAACIWTVLNRADASQDNITHVVSAPMQFQGYCESNPIDDHLLELAYRVLSEWEAEKDGWPDAVRVLPSDYRWFRGDGERNHFYNTDGVEWDWSFGRPYDE